jgi:hypothetical protein
LREIRVVVVEVIGVCVEFKNVFISDLVPLAILIELERLLIDSAQNHLEEVVILAIESI